MVQTFETIVDEMGKIRLLTEILWRKAVGR
jgi:hypothetical protein